MPKSNLRVLTKDELEYLNDRYVIELLDRDHIVISCRDYDRRTLHDVNKSFTISSPRRKITITIDAIEMWITVFKEKGKTLIDVQNAMNALIVTYQDLSIEDVAEQINRGGSEINIR